MKIILTGFLSLGVVLASVDFSVAQTASPNRYGNAVQEYSVPGRARPGYDAVGARAGSFFFYPFIVESILYDDNVFASNTNKQDDWILTSSPNLLVLSDWGRHKLDFKFGLTDYRHRDFSKESHTDFYAKSDWQIDVTRDFNVAGSLGAASLTEGRGESDAPTSAAEPTTFRKYDASLSLNKQFNRFTLQVGGAARVFDYDSVDAIGGGTIDQNGRDGTIYTAVARAAYEFSPGYRVFGLMEGNKRNFGRELTDDRDSKGYQARAGLEFEITRLVKGEISAGYFEQDYEKIGFANASGMAFKGGLLWNPTMLMTVNLTGERLVSETSVAGASGHVDTILSGRVDYEIMRNLIGSPYISYTLEDYEGVDREDKTLQAGISMQLLINRHISTSAFYTFTTKDSNLDTFDYDKNVVGGSVKIQF